MTDDSTLNSRMRNAVVSENDLTIVASATDSSDLDDDDSDVSGSSSATTGRDAVPGFAEALLCSQPGTIFHFSDFVNK